MGIQIVGGNDLIAAITGGVFETIRVIETTDEMLSTSPAFIISSYLIDEAALMTLPSADGVWPLYVSSMPDMKKDCGAIYDTAGVGDGRLMIGNVVEHQGIQIKVRSVDYQDGWEKINEIRM